MARLPILNARADGGTELHTRADGGTELDVGADGGTEPIPLAGRGKIGVPGWLSDQQGRRLRYLRLSVTDRCDLRCTYCMPAEGLPGSSREDVLSFEEIVRVVRVFARLGVKTVRLTGGEPLIRRGLSDLVRMIREEAGIEDIALTTNATLLERAAQDLKRAGLSRINVSLDSTRPEVFSRMTRGGDVHQVIRGIESALDAGFDRIKTNSVVVRGANDDHLDEMVRFAWEHNITPRFIELMPLGSGAALGAAGVVSVQEMKSRLRDLIDVDHDPEFRGDRGPAGYVPAKDQSGKKVGFIGAVTENFCERCNRVRVTAKGEIRACLASPKGLSLRSILRSRADDAALIAHIEEALFAKDLGHGFYVDGQLAHHSVAMSAIGG